MSPVVQASSQRPGVADEVGQDILPPDLPACDACLRELLDPANRRYRYPFTSCARCGPRYTIALGPPYDRAATTMARFPMCPDCQREHDDAEDRRFHAQANACPACGPRLRLLTPRGNPVAVADPLETCIRALSAGCIVAIKGLGGFHIACDATSAACVEELRSRKRRDDKPFAVMVRDLAAARALAASSPAEEELLQSAPRPIVLVRAGHAGVVAPDVAPGLARLGVMLPSTPLQHLLVRGVDKPLVMTAGNLSGGLIARGDDEAVRRLGPLVDLILAHDRGIEARADDSVAMVQGGRAVAVRRSRGYVPRAIRLPSPVKRPVLACGAHRDNAFCLAAGDRAYLSAHVGDLGDPDTFEAFEDAIEKMERLLQIRPELAAHDLDPEYLSTRYARERDGVRLAGVQHHHAHVVSAMAQNGLTGKVVGVAYDGAGLGTDGTAWGSEVLLADEAGFERLATFRPLPLPGGGRATREVWRLALVALDDAFDGAPPIERLPLFWKAPKEELSLVRQQVRQKLSSPWVHGAGRYFDAVGAIALGRPHARYEGQVAMALEQAADPRERGAYPFEIDRGRTPWRVDLRPAVRAAAMDVAKGETPGAVSMRFHRALVKATAEVVLAALREHGELPVVLSGGCFRNVLLAEGVCDALSDVSVYGPGEVPPGDGGLALGQAVVADAIARRRG